MVAIPAGKFLMGSPAAEPGRFDTEGPQHVVAVRAFAIGKYDITIRSNSRPFCGQQAISPRAMRPAHEHALGFARPCIGLSAVGDFAAALAGDLSQLDRRQCLHRLAQRQSAHDHRARHARGRTVCRAKRSGEYAARSTTTTARWWGEEIGDDNANCNGCGQTWDGRQLASVGTFGPNGFGVLRYARQCLASGSMTTAGTRTISAHRLTDVCGRAAIAPSASSAVVPGATYRLLCARHRAATATSTDKDFDYSAYAGFRVARTLPWDTVFPGKPPSPHPNPLSPAGEVPARR